VLLPEFGKPAVQSLSCLGKMSYLVHILVLEDVSHSIDLVIVLRSHSSFRMEISSVNAICTILVWIQYKIGKDKLFLYTT
jgi:predicted CoA-binding protein